MRRKEAAAKLAKRVEAELAALAMERATFQIVVRPAEPSASGKDAIEFLVSPNLGEEPKPIEKIASGGEISRIALALKTCVAAPVRRAALRAPWFLMKSTPASAAEWRRASGGV